MNIKHFSFGGGLDLVTPPLAAKPGTLIDGVNYECLPEGGYRRVDGYALFDGQATPSQAVPGSGSVLGVHIYKGEVYAVREDGTNGRLYKATASGWSEITLPALFSLGGKYKFDNYNFYGQDSQEEMFIVNSVDKAVKWDGTTAVQITTGFAGTDRPSSVKGHKGSLFLAVESSLFKSKTGDPTNYDGNQGASEIAVGDTINELSVAQGALVIGCEDGTQVLYGTDSSDFVRDQLNESRVYANTMKNIGGQVISLDNQGLFSLAASKDYGNFAYSAISKKVKPFMESVNHADAHAVLNKSKGQYRIFWGRAGLYCTFSGTKLTGITRTSFDHDVCCVANGRASSGDELTVFGSSDGNVYQLDAANFFNSNPIYGFMVFHFNHFGSPTQRKRFRKALFDLKVTGAPVTIYVRPMVDYAGNEINLSTYSEEMANTAGGGLWDFATWDNFVWDGQYQSELGIRMAAAGKNLALIISTEGVNDGSHSLYGAAIHYSPRRTIR